MEYVVVQNKIHSSATLVNFGPEKVEVRLKMSGMRDLTKSGFFVEFNDTKNLLVGQRTHLQVIFQPKPERYTERNTNVEHIIYIEVYNKTTQLLNNSITK